MLEDIVVDSVSSQNVRARVEYICSNLPSRLAGSDNGRKMAEYNADALRSVGVAAQVQEFQALVSFPRPARLRIAQPSPASIDAFTLGHSIATGESGVEGELVYVGPGAIKDYDGVDVRGRIVLCELSYSPARMEKQRIAAARGAIGAVMMNWGYPDDTAVPFGSVKPLWGNPTPETVRDQMPTLPCVGISRKAGLALKALCTRSPTRVLISTDVDNVWRPVHLTTGEISAPASEDFVIVGGHQDSWFGPAATDNAAGNACMVELARVFNAHREHLKRGIVFGFWTAHETGTMAGSAYFVDTQWDRLREHALAYLLIDQPACTGTTRWSTSSNLELRRFHQEVEKRHLDVPLDWKPQKKGGDASFFGLGIPMMYGMGAFTEAELHASADANLGWWHHTLECTIDKVDFTWMQPHLRVYAAWLWRLCTLPILPFEFVGVANQFATSLEQLSSLASVGVLGLDKAAARARQLEALARRLDEAAGQWRSSYRAADAASEHAAEVLNRCFKHLSNTLIPIQSTVIGAYGHDPYGYTPQLTVIPCLYDVERFSKLPEGSEERCMLETHLLRQRNRVADALATACERIMHALAQLPRA